ncbi:SDR family NAD(P)-dependent oxidoreductase [Xanthomonas arboricola]|uniref:SDR family NAD(P)-dependent oxidoreductase n=1 Tax=Xanthomonas arboricola TaxID=56448 RepID=UPI00161C0453|nr:SDR family NAD(P)-dependent oxidoreductase [Xanthomonas arboricola]MBB4730090.1 acyl transferase domain-containing protein/acyl carrier protein [Xanthomonas arboricola]
MSDSIEYILGELKAGRLSRDAALERLKQVSRGSMPTQRAAPGLLILREAWVPARTIGAPPADLRRIVCIVAAGFHDGARAAFADAAPHVEVRFVMIDDLSAGLTVAWSDLAGQVDALVYLGHPLEPVDAEAVHGPLDLLRALHALRLRCPRLLLCATYADAIGRCHAESWIGIERTLRVIQSDMACAVMISDAGAKGPQAWKTAFFPAMIGELFASELRNTCHSGDVRYVSSVADVDASSNDVLDARGRTFLITGGLGALGMRFAAHLSRAGAEHVVLAGRRPHAADVAARLAALRRAGHCVDYLSMDVADAAQVAQGMRQIRVSFGDLHGVIHAAGIEARDTLFDRSAAQAREVMRPKVQGTLVLDEVLRSGDETAFLCCFASAAATLGDFGSFDYAVANRFQMAYAEHLGSVSHRRVSSIGWPFWDGDGMGSDDDPQRTHLYLEGAGMRALGEVQGMPIFDRLVTARGAATVLYGDDARLRARVEAAVGRIAATPVVEPSLPAARGALRGFTLEQCVAWELTDHVAGLLELARERIEPNRNLTEFGFDSMTLTRLARRVSTHYAIELSPAIFFSQPTIRHVAAYLLKHYETRLRQVYGDRDLPSPTEPPAAPIPAAPAPATAVPAERAPMDEHIAIVGMSGRFPQARDIDELWRILVEGRDVVTDIPLDRFDWRGHFGEGRREGVPAMASKWLGAMPGIDEFDPLFFEISPRDAAAMDPRQRLLLQEAWHALEDAGYGDAQFARDRVGMFVGVEQGDYQLLAGAKASLTGNHDGILASRLSYSLDLHGPAMAINASCASGLVAAHQACVSLRAGDCDAAVAAAVNLVLTPHPYIGMSAAGMLSTDGRCFAFDRRANGMVPAEAVVALVFKRLSDARAADDVVHAIIVASGINYDGKTQGITAPNGAAQAALIRQTLARADAVPADVDYVVTHGTGTRLGDPVEVAALDEVFNDGRTPPGHCALTSTKSNLGHSFAASGLVSLVSLVLAMRHETIPASLHCEEPSDYVDWSRSAFRVNRENTPWPRRMDRRRLGAVSAFGMSGTNAHVLVQEGGAEGDVVSAHAPAFLLAVSAATDAALSHRLGDLAAMLRDPSWDAARLDALSHTLLRHRRHFAHRCAIVAEDPAQALSLIEAAQAGSRSHAVARGRVTGDFVERPSLRSYATTVAARLASQASDRAAYRESLATMGDLYCQGYDVSLNEPAGARTPRRLRLPAYPFSRQRYWLDDVVPDETRQVSDFVPASVPASSMSIGMQYVLPHWEPVAAGLLVDDPANAFTCPSLRPLVIGADDATGDAIRGHYPSARFAGVDARDDIASLARKLADVNDFDHVIWIAPPSRPALDRELIGLQEDGVLYVFRLLKALLALDHGTRPLAWTIVTFQALHVHEGEAIAPAHAGVHGLAGSLAKEFPHWSLRLLDCADDASWAGRDWSSVPADARAHPWAWRDGVWFRRHLVRIRSRHDVAPAREEGRVYVVIGGAGHIGKAWTEHMIRRERAKVVWIGRRPLDERIQADIDRLATLGPAPAYVAADATDPASLERARARIRDDYACIDGLVLSTLLLDPRALADTEEGHVRAALRAKVDVAIHAMDVFGGESVREVVFFSSMIAFIRTPLHAGYAAACTFSDAYARWLRQRAGASVPVVKTMNWGFWDRVENVELDGFAHMAKMGIGLIGAAEAMDALDRLLDGPLDQMGIVKTEKPVLVEGVSAQGEITVQVGAAMPDMARLRERVGRLATLGQDDATRGSTT